MESQSPFGRPPVQPRPSFTPTPPRPPATPASVAGPTALPDARAALEAQRRSGGQWFYWVAGLSLINSVLALTGQDWRFLLGLGVTQLIQELGRDSEGTGMTAGLVGLAVIGLFVFLGHRAVQGHGWAFVLGMVFFALDGALFLVTRDWVGVGFHAFALAMIFRGYAAARQLPSPDA